MLEHEDQKQDTDMIKTVLQKIIDEMNEMEAGRIMPEERKPKLMAAEVKTVEAPAMEEEMGEEGPELDQGVLSELMGKAESADEEGNMPEDQDDELPSELADLVRSKRKLQ